MSTTQTQTCPGCGKEMDFTPADTEGDHDLVQGTREIPAGFSCEDCGVWVKAEMRDE